MKVLFTCSFTRYGKTHVITLKRMCKPAAICQPLDGKQNKTAFKDCCKHCSWDSRFAKPASILYQGHN